jgi:hypothetical protein
MNEYTTTDVHDLDCVPLARIGGETYYELRQIVRDNGVRREVAGRASEWPLIEARAQRDEYAALLVASEERSIDADCQVVELLTRIDAYAQHIAALEAALAEAALPRITPPEAEIVEQAFVQAVSAPAAPDDGRIPCDYPGCDARIKPRGLLNHKRLAHGQALAAPAPAPVTPPEIALELGEAPWRCAQCHLDTHTRSIERPAFCIRCVLAAIEPHTNGHQVAA